MEHFKAHHAKYIQEQYLAENNDIFNGIKSLREFKRKSKNLSDIEKAEELSKIYDMIFPLLQARLNTFTKKLKSVGKKFKNSKIKARIKPLVSIISKVVSRGKDFFKISDLIAAMIITKDRKDSDKVVKDTLRKMGNFVVNVDKKERGGDNRAGYFGVTHIDLDIDGLLGELQIMPEALFKKKALAHKVYNTVRDSGGGNEFDNQLMRKLFVQGNLKESVETQEELKEAFIKEWMHGTPLNESTQFSKDELDAGINKILSSAKIIKSKILEDGLYIAAIDRKFDVQKIREKLEKAFPGVIDITIDDDVTSSAGVHSILKTPDGLPTIEIDLHTDG